MEQRMKDQKLSQTIMAGLRETAGILVLAILLSLVLRAYIVEARVIPSGSMLPTIQLNDRVLVNKFIYRFQQPERLDVIVFEPPVETGQKEDFIKRIIALPGDEVEVRGGQVFINGEALTETYLFEKPLYRFGPVTVPANSYFVMGDNRNHSYDSPLWNAWLTFDHIKGKAFYTYWPVNRLGALQ